MKFKYNVRYLPKKQKEIDEILIVFKSLKQGHISKNKDDHFHIWSFKNTRLICQNNGKFQDKQLENSFIEAYSLEEFLAIAHITEGDDWIVGEWLYCINNKKYFEVKHTSGCGSSNGYADNKYKILYRKATLEELRIHFEKTSTFDKSSVTGKTDVIDFSKENNISVVEQSLFDKVKVGDTVLSEETQKIYTAISKSNTYIMLKYLPFDISINVSKKLFNQNFKILKNGKNNQTTDVETASDESRRQTNSRIITEPCSIKGKVQFRDDSFKEQIRAFQTRKPTFNFKDGDKCEGRAFI